MAGHTARLSPRDDLAPHCISPRKPTALQSGASSSKGVGSHLRVRLSCREGRRKEFFLPKGSVLSRTVSRRAQGADAASLPPPAGRGSLAVPPELKKEELGDELPLGCVAAVGGADNPSHKATSGRNLLATSSPSLSPPRKGRDSAPGRSRGRCRFFSSRARVRRVRPRPGRFVLRLRGLPPKRGCERGKGRRLRGIGRGSRSRRSGRAVEGKVKDGGREQQ